MCLSIYQTASPLSGSSGGVSFRGVIIICASLVDQWHISTYRMKARDAQKIGGGGEGLPPPTASK